jgi:uncharacterized protein (TIGR00725 family)
LSRPAIAVFGSSMTSPGSDEWDQAADAGAMIARAGYAVVTGGYGGTMEAVSLGAHQAGGHVIGVTAPPLFPGRTGANPYVAEEVPAKSLGHRLDEMTKRAAGALALPGSIGTATELLISWNINHIVRRNGGRPFPAVAVGAEWHRIGALIASEIGAVAGDIYWADSVENGVDWLLTKLETV